MLNLLKIRTYAWGSETGFFAIIFREFHRIGKKPGFFSRSAQYQGRTRECRVLTVGSLL
jgi:hypothetical protein